MTFLLYTVVAWVATASLAKILYISIQPGQWLDKLLNWQERLRNWDLQGRELLVKAGGMCELCFSHFIVFVSFWMYLFFMHVVVGYWVSTPIQTIPAVILVNIIWYLGYVCIGTNMALYFIVKLFRP